MPKFIELIVVESTEDMKSETNRFRALISPYNEFNEIPMIKLVRELTGCDLVPAKDLVFGMRESFRTHNRSLTDMLSDINKEMSKMDKRSLKHVLGFARDLNINGR